MQSAWFTDTLDALFALFAIVQSTRAAPIRACAAQAMGLMLYRHPALLPKLVQKVGVVGLLNSLSDDSPRSQHPFLNTLNLCLRERLPRLQSMLGPNEKKIVAQ